MSVRLVTIHVAMHTNSIYKRQLNFNEKRVISLFVIVELVNCKLFFHIVTENFA